MADEMTSASLEGIEKATPECGVAQYVSIFGGQPSQQPKNPAEVSRLAPKRVSRLVLWFDVKLHWVKHVFRAEDSVEFFLSDNVVF